MQWYDGHVELYFTTEITENNIDIVFFYETLFLVNKICPLTDWWDVVYTYDIATITGMLGQPLLYLVIWPAVWNGG